jgi:hypothetical protein
MTGGREAWRIDLDRLAAFVAARCKQAKAREAGKGQSKTPQSFFSCPGGFAAA